ncbi:hypothetical protein PCIT_a2460 [Pseudoalteromonas citrea]|uniref:OmpA-like domain-containing protein n=2 Tax=Pseudoalteromonas citrea TaxID=43655 RepID=A0AAD4AJV0_9GAMM|nr:OmpA family protein [Pseudoalteromonas citrea]KAF7772397.1 hypothetical protein PCIT_a2460 [Pseudoalteromonas citrea]
MARLTLFLLIGIYSTYLSGCTMTNAEKGASVGAATGAILGKATGNHKDKRIFIGAAIGGIAGAAIGSYMDEQEAAFKDQLSGTGVSVIREGNSMRLVMPGHITFSSNQATISADFYSMLNAITQVMKRYTKTQLIITGHTDSEGNNAFNQGLSEQRAKSVKDYLSAQQIDKDRLSAKGLGEQEPVATNATAQGRAQNRRVEINITPS